MFEELWGLSKAITSHAIYTNAEWPMVTLPNLDWRIHGENTRSGRYSGSTAEFIGFAPYVLPESKEAWEKYSVANQGWIAEDIRLRYEAGHNGTDPDDFVKVEGGTGDGGGVNSSSSTTKKTELKLVATLAPIPDKIHPFPKAHTKDIQSLLYRDSRGGNYGDTYSSDDVSDEGTGRIRRHLRHSISDAASDEGSRELFIEEEGYEFTPEVLGYQIPLWQTSPPPRGNGTSIINMDLASHPILAHILWDVKVKKVEQYSRAIDVSFLMDGVEGMGEGGGIFEGVDGDDDAYLVPTPEYHPRGTIYQPVFDNFSRDNSTVVGFVFSILTWDNMFTNVLFDSSAPLLVEIEGNCSRGYSYLLMGSEVQFLGRGNSVFHNPEYDKYKRSSEILLSPLNSREGYPDVAHAHRPTDAAHNESHCQYIMHTYPTDEFVEGYRTQKPIYYTIAIGCVFVCTALVFLVYDWMVQRRQKNLLSIARKTNAIVSSLFPAAIQQRMMKEQDLKEKKRKEIEKRKKMQINTNVLLNTNSKMAVVGKDDKGAREMSTYFRNNSENLDNLDADLPDGANGPSGITGTPICDLFPSATIM